MFRIGYMSDLHLEFEDRGPSSPTGAWFALQKARRTLAKEGHPNVGPLLADLRGQIDLMVIAGDTNTPKGRRKGLSGVRYGDQVARYLGVPVVVLAGNHEFFDGDLEEEIRELRKEATDTEGRVTFLERDHTVFDLPAGRLHVLGCTLWTDFALFGDVDLAADMAATGMNDFRCIGYSGRSFAPADAIEIHRESRGWLGETIAGIRVAEPEASILIVTHHAPSIKSIPKNRLDDVLTAAYASNVTTEVGAWHPSAWIHGHIHGICGYAIAKTPIRAAARGYIGHEIDIEAFSPQVLPVQEVSTSERL